MKKKLISFLLVIIWMVVIFLLSGMTSIESNNKSTGTINSIINTLEITNGTGITDKHPTQEKKKSVAEMLNKPLRKLAHASVYLVLVILVINLLRTYEVSINKSLLIAIIICFIYAITDEYHQTFVEGRSGQFSDVLIDTIGSFIGALIYKLIYTLQHKRKIIK